MRILAVDDEELQLEKLADAIREVLPEAELVTTKRPSVALCYAEEQHFDVAFLDIEMRGMYGTELASLIRRMNPRVNIIFVTAFSIYKADAMDMRASGYIMKPVSAAKIRAELEDLRYPLQEEVKPTAYKEEQQPEEAEKAPPEISVEAEKAQTDRDTTEQQQDSLLTQPAFRKLPSPDRRKRSLFERVISKSRYRNEEPVQEEPKLLQIQCFGLFQVYDRHQNILLFERSKSREAFAYLIWKQGKGCTDQEIARILYSDREYNEDLQKVIDAVMMSMMNTLNAAGARDVIRVSANACAVNTDKISCDYYDNMSRRKNGGFAYSGAFMSQYTWTAALDIY